MNKQNFMTDLQTIYDELQFRQGSLNKYYELLEEGKVHDRANAVVDAFLKLLEYSKRTKILKWLH